VNYKKCKEHEKPEVRKWGISGSEKWCEECKKLIPLIIDFTGHP